MSAAAEIPPELATLFESGVALWVATCGVAHPEVARAMGARVGEDGRRITLYVPSPQLGCTLENLAASPEVAVMFLALITFQSVQVKGRVVSARDAESGEREYIARYHRAFVDALVSAGMAREIGVRLIHWPATALEIEVRELFQQTPGPQAGTPWR